MDNDYDEIVTRDNEAIENTWDAIEEALRSLVQDDDGAQEVASAFYDVAWVPVSSSYSSYGEAFGQPGCFSTTWRNAGEMVARLRGRGETYMDWCYEAEAEVVSDRVRRVMASLCRYEAVGLIEAWNGRLGYACAIHLDEGERRGYHVLREPSDA